MKVPRTMPEEVLVDMTAKYGVKLKRVTTTRYTFGGLDTEAPKFDPDVIKGVLPLIEPGSSATIEELLVYFGEAS